MKNITLILLFLTGGLFAQTSEIEIGLTTESGNIKGTLLCPSTSDKVPVVLIIAGSGPTDRNGNNPMMSNNSLKMLAEGLLENEIATVRYDKRGIGESKDAALNESELRFDHLVEDVVSWIDTLKKDIRFSEIIVLGHSEGSLIGMIAAQKEEVDKFISLSGAGETASEILRKQLKAQAPIVLNEALPILEKLEKGKTVEDIPVMLFSLFRPSVQPYLISWFRFDPQKEIAKLDKPILVVQGTTDIQVSVSDAEMLVAANEKAEKHIIEGMNHVLKEATVDRAENIKTYGMPELPLKEELIDLIVSFIKK